MRIGQTITHTDVLQQYKEEEEGIMAYLCAHITVWPQIHSIVT